jgi:hypothetical protein
MNQRLLGCNECVDTFQAVCTDEEAFERCTISAQAKSLRMPVGSEKREDAKRSM